MNYNDRITISSYNKDYTVNFEESICLFDRLSNIENAYWVVDDMVYGLYNYLFDKIDVKSLYRLKAMEENKIIDTALGICEKITSIPAKRNATLISVGGGVIQDITGFVASIMYRGINWIFIPTTLLAACDSCIGGKTSLNYLHYKNLLGTFYPPDSIYICLEFFNTLSEKDYLSGLGEVVKFNIMKGVEGLACIEKDIERLIKREPEVIRNYVTSSLNFKKPFIEEDEFDKGRRILLNFAHTFGHAIEVISAYKIPHGTAVAIGMIMADSVSLRRGYISDDITRRIEEALLKVIKVKIEDIDVPIEEFLGIMRKDKKQVSDSLTTVLISSYGECATLELVRDTTFEEIDSSIRHFRQLYANKSF